MPPDFVAAAVAQAVQRHQRVLIPGAGNKLFAIIGRWLPSLAEWAMRTMPNTTRNGLDFIGASCGKDLSRQ